MDESRSTATALESAAQMMTDQEMTNMTRALKDPEFRKLLAEYCNEMADPKNQALYEQELTQYEAERGIELTFIRPEPGFVIKTVVGGRQKAFINVCRNDKVDRPTSRYATDENGRRGLQWSIPLTQAPPRHDLDNKRQKCTVYDVVFHPDTLHLAGRNREFRQLVVSTACDAVESAFQVSLDRVNVRFPKMTFKGTPQPTVIRRTTRLDNHNNNKQSRPSDAPENNNKSAKKTENDRSSDDSNDSSNRSSSKSKHKNDEWSGKVGEKEAKAEDDERVDAFEDQFYPKVDMSNLNGDRPVTVIKSGKGAKKQNPNEKGNSEDDDFAIPTHKLVHRRPMDLQEMTYERDAKLNTTLPKDLILTVDLPLLPSAQTLKLDVREREVELMCREPAKYRLKLPLPHAVLEDEGSAQFDSVKRQLTVTLPVNRRRAELKLEDLTRVLTKQASDSGVDSPSSHSHSSDEEERVEEQEEKKTGKKKNQKKGQEEEIVDSFLDKNTAYQLPQFTANVLDQSVVFTLNVKNVDPSSVALQRVTGGSVAVKFSSVGAGFSPVHYALFVDFGGAVEVSGETAEAWDNNVVLQLELKGEVEGELEFLYGVAEEEKSKLIRSQLRNNNNNNSANNNNNMNMEKNHRKMENGEKTEGVVVVSGGLNPLFAVQVREGQQRDMTIELTREEEKRNKKTVGNQEKGEEYLEEEVFHTDHSVAEDHHEEEEIVEQKMGKQGTTTKAGKRKENKRNNKRKGRSLSESDLKSRQDEQEQEKQEKEDTCKASEASSQKQGSVKEIRKDQSNSKCLQLSNRKPRSVSESGGGDIVDANGNLFHFKGILKRRSISESCSDVGASSLDMGIGSFKDIPEEELGVSGDGEEDEEEDSEHHVGSEKKHVTFNDVIRKQEFRADASIVGRKLKNLKKRAKKRADARRLSESENSEAEDKHLSTGDEDGAAEEEEEDGEEVIGSATAEVSEAGNVRRDSGVDFSDEGNNGGACGGEEDEDGEEDEVKPDTNTTGDGDKKRKKNKRKGGGKRRPGHGKEAEFEFKSGMIFNLEM